MLPCLSKLFAIAAVIFIPLLKGTIYFMVDFMATDSGNLAFNSEASSPQLHTKAADC